MYLAGDLCAIVAVDVFGRKELIRWIVQVYIVGETVYKVWG